MQIFEENFYISGLPSLKVSHKAITGIEKNYLDFIMSIFTISHKFDPLPDHIYNWFLEELIIYLKLCYPKLTKDDRISILKQMILSAEELRGEQ